jgi:hypothetical protein
MPWTSLFQRRSRTGSSRGQPDFTESHSLSPDSSQTPPALDYPSADLPVLPPELWLRIIDFLPLENLWFIRRTCRLFHSLALIRVWHLIRDTEVGVLTSFESEHEPLSYISTTPQLLCPSLPATLSMNLHGTKLDDPVINNMKKVIWSVVETEESDCEDLRMSYQPHTVEIKFTADVRAVYRIERPLFVYGPLKDLVRKEAWSIRPDTKSRSSKLSKFFSSNATNRETSQWSQCSGPTPEWIVEYAAEYGFGRNDDGNLVRQLKQISLQRVSLPVWQVIGTLIDACKAKIRDRV